MRAKRLVFPDQRKVDIETVELPETIGGDEILLENELSIISPGTELAMYTKTHVGFPVPENKYAKYPFRPGYASVGRVLKVGPAAAARCGLREGDAVVSMASHASHAVVDHATRLPAGLSSEKAVFGYLAQIALMSIYASDVRLGMDVAVVGQGLIGNLAAQLMRAAGARTVIALDTAEHRLQVSRECGLRVVVNPAAGDAAARVKSFTGGRGAHVVVEATGNPHVASSSLAMVAKLGKLILLGSPRGPASIDLYFGIHAPGIAVIGAHGNHLAAMAYPGAPVALELMLEMIADGRLVTSPLISHRLMPADAASAYEGLELSPNDYLGILLDLRSW